MSLPMRATPSVCIIANGVTEADIGDAGEVANIINTGTGTVLVISLYNEFNMFSKLNVFNKYQYTTIEKCTIFQLVVEHMTVSGTRTLSGYIDDRELDVGSVVDELSYSSNRIINENHTTSSIEEVVMECWDYLRTTINLSTLGINDDYDITLYPYAWYMNTDLLNYHMVGI